MKTAEEVKQLVALAREEAALCRNETATDIAKLLDQLAGALLDGRRGEEAWREAALGLYRRYFVPAAFRNAAEREVFERVETLLGPRANLK